jgi:hypothetical protein
MCKRGKQYEVFSSNCKWKTPKKKLFQLEQDERTILGQESLKVYITKFYKKLFREPAKNNFSMRHDITSDIPQISDIENNILTAVFSEKKSLMQYHKWIIIKHWDHTGCQPNFAKHFGRSSSVI